MANIVGGGYLLSDLVSVVALSSKNGNRNQESEKDSTFT